MLADVIDLLQSTNYLLQCLIQKDSKSPKKPKLPDPYKRPGPTKYTAKKEEKKFATTSDLKTLWG